MGDLSVVKVDLTQLTRNIAALYDEIDSDIKVLVAVKADAYGHGIEAVSRLLENAGVDYLGVSNIEEAFLVRNAGVELPLLVLMPSLLTEIEIEEVINKNIDITITSLRQANKLNHLALNRKTTIPVQVNVDTGMGRTGFLTAEVTALFSKLSEMSGLEVRGIFSHLSSAHLEDQESYDYTVEQVMTFSRIMVELADRELLPPLCHMSSSDSLLRCKELITADKFNMIRPGELFYGHNSKLNKLNSKIKPALSVVTKIIEIRNIEANKYIGYGRKFKTDRRMKTGLLPLGYAGGLDYRLSNKGRVMVRDKMVPIIGEICMNETLIDLTDLRQVKEGEEVLILGGELTADRIGDRAGMHATEVLTSFSGLKHVYNT